MPKKLQSRSMKIYRFDGFIGITITCSLFMVAILSIFWVREVKHKLALKKSFLSQNERIEDEFPHASPEGDPEDYGLYDKVMDEDEVDKDNDKN